MQPSGSSWFLTITERVDQDALVLVAAGRVGSAAAPALTEALLAAARRSAQIVLDLTDVDYISSAGVGAIAQTAARLTAQGKALVVRGAHGAARVCLEMASVPYE